MPIFPRYLTSKRGKEDDKSVIYFFIIKGMNQLTQNMTQTYQLSKTLTSSLAQLVKMQMAWFMSEVHPSPT